MSRLEAEQRKWEFLRAAPERDAKSAELRLIARNLLVVVGSRPRMFTVMAHALCRDGIQFQSDTARTGGEDITGLTRDPAPGDALDAWRRGVDDCDAKARLFCALCLAVGLPARMVAHWKPTAHDGGAQRLAHVSAEVSLDGQWLPIELTLARARLGERGEDVPKERDGQWKTS